jgi:2-oxoisovalerate dehydrogenase E1 component beta subunit
MSEKITYLDAITKGLREELESDKRVYILGEDVGQFGGAFKVTRDFLEMYGPERIMDTPLAESAIIGVGVGSALVGMRPVIEMQFMDFISSGFNQIVNVAAKFNWRLGSNVPLVIRGPSGGGVNGGPYHSQNPEGWFTQVPGLKVVSPATAIDAKGLIKSAIRDPNPVLYFEHKYLYRRIKEVVPDDDYTTPIGKAAIRREGTDLTIITYASMVWESLEAAKELEKEEISVEVVDLRSLLPYDKEMILESAKKTGKVLIVHEACLTYGPGAEMAAFIADNAFEYLDGPVKRLASKDTPVPYSKPLEAFFMPKADKIADAARELAAY